MKKTVLILLFIIAFNIVNAQQKYIPSAENLESRAWFKEAKYGLFIHWGLFSILGDGEWVMNEKNINVKNYTRLESFFNPIDFNAHDWVKLAKESGIKYITLITRHHDGFSLWDTKYSDFNVMNTPFKRDIVKEITEECHKQGVKIFLYYSLLDWRRDDYSYWTGRSGKGTGRTVHGKWEDYIQFMKNQLTELLTKYGKVDGIWFDGYWDQMAIESINRDNKEFVDWHLREIYDLIHKIQPNCLVGNNHHIDPKEGEDFQMFERDLPGENEHGLSFQKLSKLPVEVCATMNESWGFKITDTIYKNLAQITRLLVRSAANGGNLLLNIGPMPNGAIQPEFKETLRETGTWLKTYGETIYGTTAGYEKPKEWGAITQKGKEVFVHLMHVNKGAKVVLENFPFKVKDLIQFKNKQKVTYTLKGKTLSITVPESPSVSEPDIVVQINVK